LEQEKQKKYWNKTTPMNSFGIPAKDQLKEL